MQVITKTFTAVKDVTTGLLAVVILAALVVALVVFVCAYAGFILFCVYSLYTGQIDYGFVACSLLAGIVIMMFQNRR